MTPSTIASASSIRRRLLIRQFSPPYPHPNHAADRLGPASQPNVTLGSSLMRGDGVDEEFGEFVAARSGSLCRTAYLLTGDWQAGEDLVQEALTRTYLRRRRLRDEA